MNDGSTGNPATPETDPENISMLDKILEKNPFSRPGSGVYANIETKSAIKSSREEAREQLAAIEAYNAEVRRRQKIAEDAAIAKRTTVRIVVGVFFVCLIIALGWLGINIFVASQPSVAPREKVAAGETKKTELVKVEGYKCNNATCGKIAELAKPNIIIQDGASFFIYNTEDKTTTLTVIPEKEYHAITPFDWAGKTYAILDPEVGQSAIYDIAGNRMVTSFAYDNFYTNPSDDMYKYLSKYINTHILAKSSGIIQLVNISNGAELVRSSKRIAAHDAFLFGYENDGSMHFYNAGGQQISVIGSDDHSFIYDSQVLIIHQNNSYEVYDTEGNRNQKDSSVMQYLKGVKKNDVLSYVEEDASFFRVPTE